MSKYPQQTHPYSQLTQQIIGLGIKIHKEIGPGFREKYYQRAMYLELQNSGMKFEREKKVRIPYGKGGKVTLGYHILDFIVEGKVVVELKSMKAVTDVEVGQLSAYLRLAKREVGLILNFGQNKLEIKRVKV